MERFVIFAIFVSLYGIGPSIKVYSLGRIRHVGFKCVCMGYALNVMDLNCDVYQILIKAEVII